MIPPTVSVVVPSHDDATLLDRCLTAIGQQTRRPDEVVVVDNASSDDTAGVAARHGARLAFEGKEGVSAAAFRGYDEARCDLVLRLDADSTPPATWVERIVQRFAAAPTLAALTGPGRFEGGSHVIGVASAIYMGIYFDGIGAVLGARPVFGSNLAMRREAWQRVSPLVHREDPAAHDDLELSVHLAEVGAPVRLDRSLVVGISAVPLDSLSGLMRRGTRAAHTLAMHGGLRGAVALCVRNHARRARTPHRR